MPNITEFDAGNLAIRPTETGVESFAQAGRRAGAFYNQAGESQARLGAEFGSAVARAGDTAVNYMDHQQINAGADHGATLFANLTDSWNKTSANADVHDPTVAQKWREEQLEPALEQFAQGFTTQKSQDWANRFVNTQREHFFTKTEADMSSMASVAVHESVTNAVTKYSNTAVSDPSSVDTSIKLFKQNLDDVIAANPNIKGSDAARVRLEVADKGVRQIVQAGAMGAIMNARDPEAAAAAIAKKYPDYVSGAEELQFARAARTYAHMNAAASRAERVAQDYENRQNFNAAADKLELSTLPQKVGDSVTLPPNYWDDLKKIGAQSGVDPARLRSLIDNGERVTERMNMPKVANDQALSDSLFARAISDPTFSERDIAANITHLDDNNVRRLSETVKMLRDDELNNPFFKSAMAGAKELIEGKTDLERSMSAGKFAEFEYKFLRDYLAAARSGKLPANALDLEHEGTMISDAIKPYRNTVQEMLRKSLGTNGMAAPPPVPTQPAPGGAPTVGTTKTYQGKVYQFQGGDWNDPKSWKEIS